MAPNSVLDFAHCDVALRNSLIADEACNGCAYVKRWLKPSWLEPFWLKAILAQSLLAVYFVQEVVITTLMSQWWNSSNIPLHDRNAWWKSAADRSADDEWQNDWWLYNVCKGVDPEAQSKMPFLWYSQKRGAHHGNLLFLPPTASLVQPRMLSVLRVLVVSATPT